MIRLQWKAIRKYTVSDTQNRKGDNWAEAELGLNHNHGCQQKISPALKPQIQIFSNPEIKNKTRKLLILLSVSCLLTHLVAFYDACYC